MKTIKKITIKRRLSNGPIESFNNIPKDLKRITNGTSNFEYARQRILCAKRYNTHILAIPKEKTF